MNVFYKFFFISFLCLFLFSSCGTIFGGAKYYAHVTIDNHPNASITYKGINQGYGSAIFKVPRLEANKFTITVAEQDCGKQNFTFKQRKIRGWALVGSILTWAIINGIPLPLGIAVDLATGALWKPDIMEKGVSKIDHKHFTYVINNYTGCKQKDSTLNKTPNPPTVTIKSKTERLFDLKILLDRGILTQEEFDKEKKKILDEP